MKKAKDMPTSAADKTDSESSDPEFMSKMA